MGKNKAIDAKELPEKSVPLDYNPEEKEEIILKRWSRQYGG
ncbi:hypothetical protein [Paenibacillus sp. FSL E2-0201]